MSRLLRAITIPCLMFLIMDTKRQEDRGEGHIRQIRLWRPILDMRHQEDRGEGHIRPIRLWRLILYLVGVGGLRRRLCVQLRPPLPLHLHLHLRQQLQLNTLVLLLRIPHKLNPR